MPVTATRVLSSLGVDEIEVGHLVGLGDLGAVTVSTAPPLLRRIWLGPVSAMTLGRRIFIAGEILGGDREALSRVILHELVHVRQWKAEGGWRFLSRYVLLYLSGRLRGRSHRDAYAEIPFEAEARLLADRIS